MKVIRTTISERCIAWNDADLGIDWPKGVSPSLSAKDAHGLPFKDAPVFA